MASPNNDNIAPDVPHMRSVLIRSPSSFDAAPGLAFGATPTINKPPVVHFNSTTPAWIPEYRAFPDLHPLGRSHVYIKNGDFKLVANRISNQLRKSSIAAVFDDEKAMAVAETSCHVRFAIHLFASSAGNVIVEVERRSGCCFAFCQASRMVLNAALGNEPKAKRTMLPIPDCVLKETEKQESVTEEVEAALDMLQGRRVDLHLLGMEALEQLTRASNTKLLASRAILTDPILDKLKALIQSWKLDDNVLDLDDADYAEKMHRFALTVLSNALDTMAAFGELSPALATTVATKELLAALVSELKHAEDRPHDACQAARAIKALAGISTVRARIFELDAPKALAIAQNEGASRHTLLEKEARQLQAQLGVDSK